MSIKNTTVTIVLLLTTLMICCRPDDPAIEPEDPQDTQVSVDLDKVPYAQLSDYHFFVDDIRNQQPNSGVLPYKPISALFSDYASKKRFVWMPEGKKASYNGDGKVLEFPEGTVLIKTFYYDHIQPDNTSRLIETRVMIRKDNKWIFAEYVWNEDQTDAHLDMAGSYTDINWQKDSGELIPIHYRIPSETECFTCHKSNEQPIPIGPKPQNLNNPYPFEEGTKNQLQRWIEVGYLEDNLPQNIVSTVDYYDATQPLDLRIRSYVDINCAHCHQEGSHCDYRPLRLAFSETGNPDNLGVCIPPDENVGSQWKYIILPQRPERSVMYYRLMSTDENVRMPLLSRSIVHEEGVALLEEWINTLESCN